MQKLLLKNQIKCLLCDDTIWSKHRHDWVECSCGSCYVDGGYDYFRIGGDLESIEQSSVWFDFTEKNIKKSNRETLKLLCERLYCYLDGMYKRDEECLDNLSDNDYDYLIKTTGSLQSHWYMLEYKLPKSALDNTRKYLILLIRFLNKIEDCIEISSFQNNLKND